MPGKIFAENRSKISGILSEVVAFYRMKFFAAGKVHFFIENNRQPLAGFAFKTFHAEDEFFSGRDGNFFYLSDKRTQTLSTDGNYHYFRKIQSFLKIFCKAYIFRKFKIFVAAGFLKSFHVRGIFATVQKDFMTDYFCGMPRLETSPTPATDYAYFHNLIPLKILISHQIFYDFAGKNQSGDGRDKRNTSDNFSGKFSGIYFFRHFVRINDFQIFYIEFF